MQGEKMKKEKKSIKRAYKRENLRIRAIILKSEWIHPKLRNEVIREIK
jgi:hypothetical protein